MSASRAWLRIARRELAGGLGGFWIYLACLALGAWAIAAAGSITASFGAGLDLQARLLLGGDAGITISQREATDEERTWMADRSTAISEAAGADLMGHFGQAVKDIDVRSVDAAFPLIGQFTFNQDAPPLPEIFAKKGDAWGAAVSESLLKDLGMKLGDTFQLGEIKAEARALLKREPDRIGDPGAFQPRAVIALDAMRETGQLVPGRLFRTTYRLLLKPEYAPTFEHDINGKYEHAGLRYRDPSDAIDGLRNLIDMLNTFMSVVGIAALVAGGVGVSQATTSFLESRIDSIAALKALGADGGMIRAAYATQLGVLAGAGALAGVALGAASPWLLRLIGGDQIPLPQVLGLYPLPLLKAFVLTLLAAMMFAAVPLGRARATPPAALFRREGGEALGDAPAFERWVAGIAAVVLVAVSTTGSVRPVVTVGLLIGAGIAYLVFAGAALLVKRLARIGARGSRGFLRLALSNLGGPGSLAPVVAPALGLGLALMCLITVVQTNLLGQLKDTAPANAPSVIFRQIPQDAAPEFDKLVAQHGVDITDYKSYRRAPFLFGRVISIKGAPLDESKVPPDAKWVTRGEVTMTFLNAKPPEAVIHAGQWWPENYTGPLLVSVEEEAAKGLGLKVGDQIGFRVFGREVEGKVASIRKVDWSSFGANMTFILSPGTLEAAKPMHIAIVIIPPSGEEKLVRDVATRWPSVLSFQLRRTLETAADLFGKISLAVTALAGVVTIAGVLVLFGSFAAAARRRRRESALLKVFGATRPAILALYAFEFALAALVAAVLGAALGIAAAHPIVIQVFDATWRFAWGPVLTVGFIAVISAAAGGAAVGWATLSHRPAQVLRSA